MRGRSFAPADLAFALLLLLALTGAAVFSHREEGGGFPELPAAAPPVDVNRAAVATLAALPGVGPSLAARIVRFREEHGPFRHLQELQRVAGIGPRRFARIAPLLTVTEEGQWSTK